MKVQPPGESLSQRGAMLLALWVGFYVLSLGLSAGLLFAGYVLIFRSHTTSLFVIVAGLGSAVAGLLIVWSSFPRWKKFERPGPRLDPRRHPRLYEEIVRISRDLRQKPPAEIYLEADINARVTVRGGFLGLFHRRVLSVGLPLLRLLSLAEFRSVLAHEFGHFAGGDERLTPWVYRTHAALERTIETLEGTDSLWRFPFLAYAKFFTRTSRGISRRQELAADVLAAKVGGVKAFARALRILEEAGNAFPSFVRTEMLPVLGAEFRPPLCEGFDRFRAAGDVRRAVMKIVGRELADRKRDPYHTHPPLGERLDALAALPPVPELPEARPARDLVDNLDALELDLLVFVTGNEQVRKFPTLAWADVAEKALLPGWREEAAEQRPKLRGVAPDQFLDLDLTALGRRMGIGNTDPGARAVACRALGMALVVALRDQGWSLHAEPGERVAASQGEHRIEPFHVFVDYAEGKLSRETWRERCRTAGIEGLNLGPAEPTA